MNEEIQLFQPSNHTHGMIFMAAHCDKCAHMPHSMEAKNQCQILGRTFMHQIGDKEYPREWRYVDGKPTCTRFISREDFNAQRRAARKARPRKIADDDMFSEAIDAARREGK